MEPVAVVPDDVPRGDLGGGRARPGLLCGQAGGEFGDPPGQRGLVGGLREAGRVHGFQDGADDSVGDGGEFVSGGGGQAALADGAEGAVRACEADPGLPCPGYDLPAGRGRPGPQQVIDLLPALDAPTVSELHKGRGYAVEAVVPKRVINTLIPALSDAGAGGILELPIAKIVP